MTPLEATPAAQPPRSAIPYLIISAFMLFAAYIGVFVQRAMRTSVELVSADYYQQELDYQQRITAQARAAALPGGIQLTAGFDRFVVQLPAGLAGLIVTGTVRFVRPADARLDFTMPFRPAADLSQTLNIAHLAPGHWRVELDFAANDQRYFVAQTLDQ